MSLLKALLTLILLSIRLSTYGLQYLRVNEKLIFSFMTTNNKKVVLARDFKNRYIVYRFGSSNKIELEYPKLNKSSWKLFKYSTWLRGGGSINEGIDLNYVYFTKGNYKYVIYETYYAVGNKSSVGIYVINLSTNKRIDIKGLKKTINGSLSDLRENRFITNGQELFD